ncbi:hypothetical protein SAMN05216490_0562 [Mucilaginibacter mallensis]|uniref:Uncharacterized protein n=1 Tax=Mucilaginibacter mallensis TaxID=652787 RepID=A0A1H1PIW0_MUCMA|nr:hypothetical protein SAMN05216490_0562 [Mucilaginibacter mallensis]
MSDTEKREWLLEMLKEEKQFEFLSCPNCDIDT